MSLNSTFPQARSPEQSTLGCEVHKSGWNESGSGPADLRTSGKQLAVDFRHWVEGETRTFTSSRNEHMGAVLEGRFRLECEEDVHELLVGQGILIPSGVPYKWTALSDGLLYQVTGPAVP